LGSEIVKRNPIKTQNRVRGQGNDMGHWWRQNLWWTRRSMNTSLPCDLSVGIVLTMCARSHIYQHQTVIHKQQ